MIYGLVCDFEGCKMFKLFGNGVDLIEVIDKYGVDFFCYIFVIGLLLG